MFDTIRAFNCVECWFMYARFVITGPVTKSRWSTNLRKTGGKANVLVAVLVIFQVRTLCGWNLVKGLFRSHATCSWLIKLCYEIRYLCELYDIKNMVWNDPWSILKRKITDIRFSTHVALVLLVSMFIKFLHLKEFL